MKSVSKIRIYIRTTLALFLGIFLVNFTLADTIIPGDLETSLQVIKRLLITTDGSPMGSPIADLNSGGNIIFYPTIHDSNGNPYISHESDPIFSSSSAAGITSTQISHWNNAYSRGNHSTMGYLTSESDPLWFLEKPNYYTKTEVDNLISSTVGGLRYKGIWDYSTGALPSDVSLGYFYKISTEGDYNGLHLLTGDMIIANEDVSGETQGDNWDVISNTVSETDPVFSSSVVAGIGSLDITHWNDAYSRGNHNLMGYLTGESDPIWILEKDNYYTKEQISSKGYLTGEIDPQWNADKSDYYTKNDINTKGYLTNFSETDPEWNAASGNYYTKTTIDEKFNELSGNVGGISNESDPIWSAISGDYYTKSAIDAKGFLTSFNELDPLFSASAAYWIIDTDISSWNDAYSRGNHALMGYLTSFSELDPLWNSASGDYYTKSDIDTKGYITGQVWKQSGTTLNYMSGNVGIGTTSPGAKLSVVGTGTAAVFEKDSDSATVEFREVGTTGYAAFDLFANNVKGGTFALSAPSASIFPGAFWMGPRNGNPLYFTTQSNPVVRMAILDNGNVGIGTTSPSRLLTVNGDAQFGSTTSSATSTPLNVSFGGTYGNSSPGNVANLKWDMFTNGLTNNRYGIGMSSNLMEYQAGTNGQHAFFVNQGNEAMRILANGNVGIGTTSAPSKLSIYGIDDKDLGPIINMGGYGVNQYESGRFRFTETNMSQSPYYQGAFLHYNGSANTFNIGVHNINDALVTGDMNSISILRASGNVNIGSGALYTTYGGSVGVGTINPTGKLNVVDNGTSVRGVFFDNYNGSSSTAWRRANGTAAAPTQVLANDVLGFFGFRGYTSAGSFSTISSAYIQATAVENFTATAQGGQLEFGTTPIGSVSNAIRMVINSTGNVGIGTNAPTQELEVNGDIKIPSTGSLFVGSDTINSGTIANWNNAYTRGNHANMGYLTGELDPIWGSEKTNYYTKEEVDIKTDITAIFSGLNGLSGTDSLFLSSPAATISSLDISHRNDSYSRGNHADMGYLKLDQNTSTGKLYIPTLDISPRTESFDKVWIAITATSFTDQTTESKTTRGTAFTPMMTNAYKLYLGKQVPFSSIYFDLAVAAAGGGVLHLEYWNGTAWTDLSNVVDGTNNFAQDGTIKFDVPSNWSTTGVNAVDEYYIRIYTTTSTSPDATVYLALPNTNAYTGKLFSILPNPGDTAGISVNPDGTIVMGNVSSIAMLGGGISGVGALAGVTSISMGGSLAGVTTLGASSTITSSVASIGTGYIGGVILNAATAATLAIPIQNSPILRFSSQAWNTTPTAATKINAMDILVVPTSGLVTSARMSIKNTTINGVADSTELVSILTSGFMGIGTTTPSSKLDVAGDIELPSTGSVLLGEPNTEGTRRITTSGGALSFQVYHGSAWEEKSTIAP